MIEFLSADAGWLEGLADRRVLEFYRGPSRKAHLVWKYCRFVLGHLYESAGCTIDDNISVIEIDS